MRAAVMRGKFKEVKWCDFEDKTRQPKKGIFEDCEEARVGPDFSPKGAV